MLYALMNVVGGEVIRIQTQMGDMILNRISRSLRERLNSSMNVIVPGDVINIIAMTSPHPPSSQTSLALLTARILRTPNPCPNLLATMQSYCALSQRVLKYILCFSYDVIFGPHRAPVTALDWDDDLGCSNYYCVLLLYPKPNGITLRVRAG
jgi:hypothetical protein